MSDKTFSKGEQVWVVFTPSPTRTVIEMRTIRSIEERTDSTGKPYSMIMFKNDCQHIDNVFGKKNKRDAEARKAYYANLSF
jgi:hypothetical protein